MPAERIERIGPATLYLGDCREIAPGLERPAAIIADPPYGQKLKPTVRTKTKRPIYRGCQPQDWGDSIFGDDQPFDPSPWLRAADIVLLWGAHKFADRLPPGGQWLVWDKVPTGKLRCQGDGEAAWLNANRPMRLFRALWDGLCVDGRFCSEVGKGKPRVHPTQKPVALMRWCIGQARVPAGGAILDPWMGAGGTGLAALAMGHPFTGIEIEPRYFDTACRRIEAAVRAAAEAEARAA